MHPPSGRAGEERAAFLPLLEREPFLEAILGKLGVESRGEAVAQARRLGLLEQG